MHSLASGGEASRTRPPPESTLISSHSSLATLPLRRRPPVRPLALLGQALQRCSDRLDIGARPADEAELPELARRLLVLVDHLVDLVDADRASVVPLDRLRHVLDQSRELGLVIS